MIPLKLFIPGEPGSKGRPRWRKGQTKPFTPAGTRLAERDIKRVAIKAMQNREPFDGPLFLLMVATYECPSTWSETKKAESIWKTSKPDFDNILKIVDALNKIVWTDDARVVSASIVKLYGATASTEILIREAMLSDLPAAF